MAPRCRAVGIAEHAGQLGDAVLAMNQGHVRRREPPARLLRDDEMPIGARGDLRQMRDHQDLVPLGDFAQRLTHPGTDLATDAGVHLVEHQRRHRIVPAQRGLERQHQARELATRRALREGPVLHALIQPHFEPY